MRLLFLVLIATFSTLVQGGVDEEGREKRTLNLLGLVKPKEDTGVDEVACRGAKNEKGKCTPIENCVLRELKEDYVKFKEYFCILDKGLYREVGVCCPEGRREEEDEGLETAASENRPPVAPAIISIEENEVNSSLPEDYYARLGEPNLCGYNGKKISRIVGGEQADKRDWPWMAVILRRDDFFHFCGGVLITRRHVLTAAHCVVRMKTKDILVRLGEYDFRTADETISEDMEVSELRNHEDFDLSSYENDIAILKLAKPVAYSMYIQPICLPLPGPSYANTSVVVAGWGTLSYGGPMSDVLMEVVVPVWEQAPCVGAYVQTIFDTNLCAGSHEGGKDSCQGDSGGPLMAQREDGRWVTIGVVSWGIRCAEKGKPGIYSRVNNYLEWIATKIQDV